MLWRLKRFREINRLLWSHERFRRSRLYRKQLNVWVLGKIATLNDADLLQYDRRRDRIAELRKELDSMAPAA